MNGRRSAPQEYGCINMVAGTVLVVDDDPQIRDLLRMILTEGGFDVIDAATGREVEPLVARHAPDVVLLDLGLPDVGGLDVLIEMTRRHDIPIIILSGRAGETDRVVGLDLGAHDYVTKPFSHRELLARVRAAIRRQRHHSATDVLDFGDLTINPATHDVLVDGQLVDLTPKEFEILAHLTASPRHVFSRAQLLSAVWHALPDWQDDATVAEHIHRLRRKLDPANRNRWIHTVRGVGYRFVPTA